MNEADDKRIGSGNRFEEQLMADRTPPFEIILTEPKSIFGDL